ncbi:acyl-CoA dehydrogenase [Egicoccus halophilus]|uniref:3-methylmercaptopropionyl-CoA dehydrogenase n=1 Tax=Egicoccus halophilus TaxID=1670830 RepID=A0A8J3AB82_9ACTN|nr:acyl-CoA dehydrogenase [Egicoccus halophilus]GGI03884.1 acyl-CoA dehydrogenase [Egicoccus halophilus]
MTTYTAPIRDIRYVLEHVTPLRELTALPAFAHAEPDLVAGLLEEVGRFSAQAIAPTNRDGDQHGATLDGDRVVLPDSFKKVYDQYVEAGWGTLQHPTEFGGGGFPLTVANAAKETINSANLAFSLGPLLTTGAVYLLTHHGSAEQQQTYLPKMVTGEWAGTMNLTEPQAGSDVGAVTTRAVPADDGSYRITGQKIYITFGEHELTENIVHLVLARLPDAPPGTKGISLFLVPKFLVNDDGSLGERNDVSVVSLEHKLGIHASPTCVMAYGEDGEGAVGYLVGEPHTGMRGMFTMMNDARLGVGIQGLAIAERAYQQALAYAQERRQGRGPTSAPGEQAPIIEHADVRRMLLTMKANIEAMRALCYANAHALDLAHGADDPVVREQQQKLADLLTPLSKAWCTDLGVELTSLAVQVHGGMGYVEETGVAQHFRDARIAPIYEGTNGIQALDLVGRKLPYDGGAYVKGVLGEIRDTVDALPEELGTVAVNLGDALDALQEATDWIFAQRETPNEVFAGATPYLRMFATVVGGWLLARGAVSASAAIASGDTGTFDAEFLQAKLTTTRFFAEQVLPTVRGLQPSVTAGSRDLYALTPALLAP